MQFRGVFSVLFTPFAPDFSIDEAGIRNQVDFVAACGCSGIVNPVNASESIFLSDDEFRFVIKTTVDAAKGRLPVIAGVSSNCTANSVALARYAADCGADGLIAQPPLLEKATFAQTKEFYRALAETGLPVFIQNNTLPIGTPLSAAECLDIIASVDGAHYIKEETQFSNHVISELAAGGKKLPEGRFLGVMGGKWGQYTVLEYERGAIGNMPSTDNADIIARIWAAMDRGDKAEARRIYELMLPYIDFLSLSYWVIAKEFACRRGLFASARTRRPGGWALDRDDSAELERIYKQLEPLFFPFE